MCVAVAVLEGDVLHDDLRIWLVDAVIA